MPPSVFSYFSPQYRIPGGLLGPEFQIYSTQTAANRANIVNAVLYGQLDKGTTVNLTPFVAASRQRQLRCSATSTRFSCMALCRPLWQQAATDAVNAATTPLAKAQAALYVVLTSGEYQMIH